MTGPVVMVEREIYARCDTAAERDREFAALPGDVRTLIEHTPLNDIGIVQPDWVRAVVLPQAPFDSVGFPHMRIGFYDRNGLLYDANDIDAALLGMVFAEGGLQKAKALVVNEVSACFEGLEQARQAGKLEGFF